MTREERIQFLLRVAHRAEGEGNDRTADLFRRMAEESRPLELEWHPTLFPVAFDALTK